MMIVRLVFNLSQAVPYFNYRPNGPVTLIVAVDVSAPQFTVTVLAPFPPINAGLILALTDIHLPSTVTDRTSKPGIVISQSLGSQHPVKQIVKVTMRGKNTPVLIVDGDTATMHGFASTVNAAGQTISTSPIVTVTSPVHGDASTICRYAGLDFSCAGRSISVDGHARAAKGHFNVASNARKVDTSQRDDHILVGLASINT